MSPLQKGWNLFLWACFWSAVIGTILLRRL